MTHDTKLLNDLFKLLRFVCFVDFMKMISSVHTEKSFQI